MSSTPPSKSLLPRALIAAWRADVPSPAELRRGYGRFTRKAAPGRALFRLTSGLAFGLILGVGLAHAASVVARSRWVTAHEIMARQTTKRTPRPHVPRRPPELVPQPPLPVAAEPPPAAASAAPSTFAAPAPSASAPSPKSVHSVPPPLDAPSRLTLPSSSSSTPYVQQQWQHAAAALRANDFTRAQSALVEVERSAAGSEREAARLARAQLLASHGRAAEALALLEELAAGAQSSVVRAQSAALLARLRQNDEQDRSTEPGSEIKR